VDCEKFESLLIDELYGELDEVTSAAVRRHAAGCARCGALLSGLRATRKVAALPVEEPSSDLEDRILSAVREQQKVLPFRARFATALSRAGAWAMRPQTAMAAVFLVVIGTSFVLVESRKQQTLSAGAYAQQRFDSEGAPVQAGAPSPMATAAASAFAFDERETAFAHGVEEKRDVPGRPLPTTIAANEMADLEKDKNADDARLATRSGESEKKELLPTNAGPIGGLDTTTAAERGQGRAAGGAGGGGSTGYAANAPMAQSQAPYGSGGVSFGSAKQLYDQQRYDEAKAQWTALAPTDPNAALWAARAEKAKNGCGTAVGLFDALRGRAPIGNDATLEAARCYRALGNSDAARARYASLASTPLATTAQTELDAMTPSAVAARKAAPAQPAQVHATATAAPQAKPAERKATAADSY
jgi:hypothetical protein